MASVVDLSVDPPQLRGGVCGVCGFVFFPFASYGCERCGAYGEALRRLAMSGQGTVTATTVVHRHVDPRRVAPFRVVAVTLDDGPSVRGVVTDDTVVGVGDRVGLVTLADTAVDDERFAVRFAAEKGVV